MIRINPLLSTSIRYATYRHSARPLSSSAIVHRTKLTEVAKHAAETANRASAEAILKGTNAGETVVKGAAKLAGISSDKAKKAKDVADKKMEDLKQTGKR
jgi:hypothetical protein